MCYQMLRILRIWSFVMSGVQPLSPLPASAPQRKKRNKPKPKPFISFRYRDCQDTSARLCDWLIRRLGRKSVRKDYYCIDGGSDLVEAIETIIPTCTAVIALIGPQWFPPVAKGRRRTSIDYVKLELLCALKHKIAIIPVLVNDTPVPNAKDVPKELRHLLTKKAIRLRCDDFEEDFERLFELLRKTAAR